MALSIVGLAAGALVGALALVMALSLQPSFTRLEQSAVQLVPPEWTAQPPVELVPDLGAFRRSYLVRFEADVTPAAAARALDARAGTLGWRRTDVDGMRQTYLRSGVLAVVSPAEGRVVTSLAPAVGRWQRAAVLAVAGAAALAAPLWLHRRWRRRPHTIG